jgi:hypothetical protein
MLRGGVGVSGLQEKQAHVRVEDGMAVIYVPADEIHGLLIALQPCPCKGPKSNATADVRKRLADALAWARNRL